MQPSNPTPSIGKPIPFSAEHIEAKQAAVNAERAAYVATLPLDVQKRFAAIEKAAQILEKAKVPFQLLALPESTAPNVGSGIWVFQKGTYLKDVTSDEAFTEASRFAYQVGVRSVIIMAERLDLMIPICHRDGKVIEVLNAPKE